MKIVAAFILFFIAFTCFVLYLVGNYGHFIFRPHMTEDWIIWGFVTVPFVGGLVLLIKGTKSMTKPKRVT